MTLSNNMSNQPEKLTDFTGSPARTPQEMEKSHEAYTGHTQEDAAQRDVVIHHRERAKLPGSGTSTGDAEIATFLGVPGQDYEATWGIAVAVRTLKK